MDMDVTSVADVNQYMQLTEDGNNGVRRLLQGDGGDFTFNLIYAITNKSRINNIVFLHLSEIKLLINLSQRNYENYKTPHVRNYV